MDNCYRWEDCINWENDIWRLILRPNGKKTNRCQVDLQRKEECQRKGEEIQGKVSSKRL